MKNDRSREQLKTLYLPPTDDFVFVDVPRMKFFMVDGEGSPDDERFTEAVGWLWAAVHPIRRIAKERMGKNFVEPPLEGLWWADDLADLVAGIKDKLRWRMMVPTAEWVSDAMLGESVDQAAKKLGEPPESLRLDHLDEGRSVQIMHVGPYEKAAAALARRLHEEFLPAHELVPNGLHHEIYLTDPRRTAPERMRTVLRQPVCDSAGRS